MTDQAANPDADAVLRTRSTLDWTILMRPGSTRRIQPSPAASWKSSIISDILHGLPPAMEPFAFPTRSRRVAKSRLGRSE
jgi:hypothetical protein